MVEGPGVESGKEGAKFLFVAIFDFFGGEFARFEAFGEFHAVTHGGTVGDARRARGSVIVERDSELGRGFG